MTPEQFVYWLQGFVELNKDRLPTNEQWDMIKENLKIAFNKIKGQQLIYTKALKWIEEDSKKSTCPCSCGICVNTFGHCRVGTCKDVTKKYYKIEPEHKRDDSILI